MTSAQHPALQRVLPAPNTMLHTGNSPPSEQRGKWQAYERVKDKQKKTERASNSNESQLLSEDRGGADGTRGRSVWKTAELNPWGPVDLKELAWNYPCISHRFVSPAHIPPWSRIILLKYRLPLSLLSAQTVLPPTHSTAVNTY